MLLKQILIVEDSPPFRNAIKRGLRSDGYSFLEANTVKEALEMCRKSGRPKVILLDLNLPDGTGRDFLESLGPEIDKFKIVVLTGHEEHLVADVAREFQIFRYLPKGPRISEALRFTTAEAFKNLELEHLLDKNKLLIKIQEQIHSDISEGGSIQETKDALHRVLNLINTSVRNIIEGYTSHIRLYDLAKGDFHLAAFAGPNDDFSQIFAAPKRRPEPFSQMVSGEKEPRNFVDLQADGDFQKWKAESLSRLRYDGAFGASTEYFNTVQSAFVAPITTYLFGDEIDAVLNVTSDSKDYFSSDKQGIILEFVSQATAAITKTWQKIRKLEIHHDYRRINRVLEDISRELGAEDTKSNIYNIVTKGIYEIIRPESISLYLYNKTTGLLNNEAEFRAGEWLESRSAGHPIDRGLTALVYTSGKPVRIPNLQTGDRRKPMEHPNANQELYNQYVERLPSGRVDHYLGVPMIIGEEVIGAVQLLNKTSDYYGSNQVDPERWLLERGFSDDCENVLGIAANHLAVSIRSADLLDQNRKQIRQLAILTKVGRFRSSEALSDLLDEIIREAADFVQAEICLLFLLEKWNAKIVLSHRYGISADDLPEASYEIGEGFTGRAAQILKTVLVERDVPRGKYDEAIIRHLRKQYGKAKTIESLMIVPVFVKGELLGVIKLINKRKGGHFDADDLIFLEQFANYVGLALENVQLYAQSSQKLATAERNAALSNLVSAVAHEIGNTHGLIRANIDLIKYRLSHGDSNILETLNLIEDAATEAVSFAEDIRPFGASRLAERTVMDVNVVLQKALQQIPPTIGKQVALELRLSPVPLLCAIYEMPLIQVFRNVVVNAYQAMENLKAGRLEIRSVVDANAMIARISFTDSGCGIRKEWLPRIFDAQFTSKRGGNGIGLWLVRTHLSAIEGAITVASMVNRGTTFTIEIPLAET